METKFLLHTASTVGSEAVSIVYLLTFILEIWDFFRVLLYCLPRKNFTQEKKKLAVRKGLRCIIIVGNNSSGINAQFEY